MADVGTPSTGLVLGIDTSVDVQVGLSRDGIPLARVGLADSRAHAEQLMPLVDTLLRDAGVTPAELDAVAVGLGPGPFTGLRVGIATATALAFALDRPWRGVCGLDVIAAEHVTSHDAGHGLEHDQFVAAIDARRHEVYWARYDREGRRLEGPHVGAVDTLPDLPVVGPVDAAGDTGPRSVDAARLAAQTYADVGVEPLYLRRPDAQVPGPRKSTLPRLLPRTRS